MREIIQAKTHSSCSAILASYSLIFFREIMDKTPVNKKKQTVLNTHQKVPEINILIDNTMLMMLLMQYKKFKKLQNMVLLLVREQ